MADSMEAVTQRFEADMAEYTAEVQRGAEDARSFARANEEAKVTVGGMRDKITEAAVALKIYRDEQGRLRNEAGEVVTASEAQAMALKHIRDKALEAAWAMRELDKYERGGLLSRLGGLLGGLSGKLGGGLGGLLGNIPGVPDVGSGGLPAALGMLGAIVDAAAAASTEITGLVSGFAAAGAGAGAFYLLAHPAIANLQADVQSLSSANQALGIAQQKYLIDPTKAHAKALHEAQVTYQAVYKQMGQDAGGAAAGVLKLHDEYVKLSDAFQPEAFKVFNGFLKLASDVLPYVTPFARTFADAITGLLGQADKFAGSKGFRDWLSQFHSLEGPSITAIGTGIGHVVTNVGKLFTLMSAKDVVNSINIAFSVIDGAIIGVVGFVKAAMVSWDALTAAWDWSVRTIRRGGHDLAHVFDDVRHDAAMFAQANVMAVQMVIRWFAALPGRILAAVGNLGHLLWNAGVAVVDGLLGGLQSAVGGVLNFIGGIGHDISSAFSSALSIGSPSRVFYQHGVNTMLGYINAVRDWSPRLLATMRGLGGQVAAGGIGLGTSGGGGYGGAPSVHVNMPVTLQGTAQLYNTPQFYQYLQGVVQEAILRYGTLNAGSGLTPAWRHG